MPLDASTPSGTCIVFGEKQWYMKRNGTAILLYKSPGMRGKYDKTARKTTILKYAELAASDPAPSRAETSSASPPPGSPPPLVHAEKPRPQGETQPQAEKEPETEPQQQLQQQKPKRVPSRFFYVVRDIDAAQGDRRLKLGITGNVPATMRAYRRRISGDQLIMTVDCGTEERARALEAHCKVCFAEFRVDRSEVYSVRPHEVARMLARQGYAQQANGLFAVKQ